MRLWRQKEGRSCFALPGEWVHLHSRRLVSIVTFSSTLPVIALDDGLHFDIIFVFFAASSCTLFMVLIFSLRSFSEGEFGNVSQRLRELRSQVAGPVSSQRSVRTQESLHGTNNYKKIRCCPEICYVCCLKKRTPTFLLSGLLKNCFLLFYSGGRLHFCPRWNGTLRTNIPLYYDILSLLLSRSNRGLISRLSTTGTKEKLGWSNDRCQGGRREQTDVFTGSASGEP